MLHRYRQWRSTSRRCLRPSAPPSHHGPARRPPNSTRRHARATWVWATSWPTTNRALAPGPLFLRRSLAACLFALCCANLPGAIRNAAAAAEDGPAAQTAAASALAYRVVVEAPRAIKDAVEGALDLVRWQGYEDMTEDLLDRLIVDAIAKAQREWLLPVGDVFRQAAWNAAKARAVATIAASPYASATIGASEARIDPDGEIADLELTITSGPQFCLGTLDVEGLSRYDAALVTNFSTIEPGERYDEARLDQFIRRLNTSGYFASVQAAIDRDPAHADAAGVHINVIEAPPRRFEAGLAFTTDTRLRGNFR